MLELTTNKQVITFPKDGIITQKWIAGIYGGRALTIDANYPLTVVKAGHVIITKDGVYKPMPLVAKTEEKDGQTVPVLDEDGNQVYEYGTLPEGFAYAGTLYKSILAKKPAASILTQGQVNIEAVYYPMDSILAAFKAACPLIEWVKDENANPAEEA